MQRLTVTIAIIASATHCRASSILIKGGTVVNWDRQFVADVLIKDGKIAAVGPNLQVKEEPMVAISGSGKYVMPGGIDPHTHLEMPFMGQVTCDDFYSGQGAALAGGTTMHIDFALPIHHDLMAGYKEWRRKAARSVMDYGFHMAVTSWSDKVGDDMAALTREGINSFKFFMAYKGALMVTDAELIEGMKKSKQLGALVMVHAENGDAVAEGQKRIFEMGITGPEGHPLSRPANLEDEATARAIRLAHHVNTPLYVVHVMSAGAMREIGAARQAGWRVIGEAVASGIAMDDHKVWDPDFRIASQYVMSPPIRPRGHATALKHALAGGALQLLGTDHAVFNSSQKAVGQHDFRIIPNGVNGIEERLHVAWEELVNSGLMTPSDFVRVTSAGVAQTFNIYPQKGCIQEGSDADVIILDPQLHHVISAASHHSNIDTNIYEGKSIKGKVVTTISQGKIVWDNQQLHIKEGVGRYIPMPTFGPLFEGLSAQDAYWHSLEFPHGPVPVKRPQVKVVTENGRQKVVTVDEPGSKDEL